ncbi:MAG: LCP family protein [Clostridia bacterium]|nr:LCP family protein [Clostridia bacterium]
MYYDTYRGKRPCSGGRRRRRRSCLGWLLGALLKLVALALVLVVLAAALLYVVPPSFLNIAPQDTELSITDGLPGSRVNILLLGLDYLQEESQRSDSMIIASIGDGSVRLASILRDTMVEIPGKEGLHKINSAYSAGGAEMAMRVVNETFDLNITNYVAIDLKTMVDLVDAVGGIEVEIEAEELEQLNKYAYNTYKKISTENPEKYAHYLSSTAITETGKLHLNGLFATSFSRIRKVGSDYARTERQREVIGAVLEKIKAQLTQPEMYVKLFNVYRESVMTNMSLPELISVAEKALLADGFETSRFPTAQCLLDDGSSIQITDAAGNVQAMHGFLYGKTE